MLVDGGVELALTGRGAVLFIGVVAVLVGIVALILERTGAYDDLARHTLGRWLVAPYWLAWRRDPARARRRLRITGIGALVLGAMILLNAWLQATG